MDVNDLEQRLNRLFVDCCVGEVSFSYFPSSERYAFERERFLARYDKMQAILDRGDGLKLSDFEDGPCIREAFPFKHTCSSPNYTRKKDQQGFLLYLGDDDNVNAIGYSTPPAEEHIPNATMITDTSSILESMRTFVDMNRKRAEMLRSEQLSSEQYRAEVGEFNELYGEHVKIEINRLGIPYVLLIDTNQQDALNTIDKQNKRTKAGWKTSIREGIYYDISGASDKRDFVYLRTTRLHSDDVIIGFFPSEYKRKFDTTERSFAVTIAKAYVEQRLHEAK